MAITHNVDESGQDAVFLKRVAGAMGATGVAMGAFGAHALKKTLDKRGTATIWQTATIYQLFHATAILSLATTAASSSASKRYNDSSTSNRNLLAGKLMGIGNLLFSGSIYCLALGIGPKKVLGPITPIGGLLMIGGWAVVGMS
mmetsp:Transcript_26386/g.72521  ORF Transcript_26386/g.72521 Transcript_26386/m.72521 type:complete len:144 (-) Transcript_26386:165-596(-)